MCTSPQFVIQCAACERQQTFLGDEDMERIGWRKIDGAWECPFCVGNERILRKVCGEDL